MDIELIPALSDNYIHLIRDPRSNEVAAIDPADENPVIDFLEAKGWGLSQIWNTHHHLDHVGGSDALCDRYEDVIVVAPSSDRRRFPRSDKGVGEGEAISLGNHEAKVLSIPGHTRDHIAYWFETEKALFCGDTLFSIGCGRVFCGSHESLYQSLLKIRELPDDTQVYCAHEYTQSNCEFALSVDPKNEDLQRKCEEVASTRAKGIATVPSTLGQEKKCNPFLRADDPGMAERLGLAGRSGLEVFRKLRDVKDRF